jgi:hypothetical protein
VRKWHLIKYIQQVLFITIHGNKKSETRTEIMINNITIKCGNEKKKFKYSSNVNLPKHKNRFSIISQTVDAETYNNISVLWNGRV